LEAKVGAELRATEVALTSIRDATGREFTLLFVLGAVGSLIGGLAVVWSMVRDIKGHKDYRAERDFFESRTKQRDEQALQVGDQQIQLGGNLLTSSNAILTGQLDSIAKVGAVIGLVQQTFEMQQKREESLAKVNEELHRLQDALAGVTTHFEKQYQEVCNAILGPFGNKSRVAWTALEDAEVVIAQRARMVFETIPESVRSRELTAHPNEFGRVAQILGTSAFYSNDVDSAQSYFRLAQRAFEGAAPDPQYRHARAFTYFYLALIEKTWQQKDVDFDLSLKQAKVFLEESMRILEGKAGEVLTPVTLAEVTSYIASERSATSGILRETLAFLHAKDRSELDANQGRLLVRAYLILGNVEWAEGRQARALEYFQRAVEHNGSDPYAVLSVAAATAKGAPARLEAFKRGLELLENSKALEKREVTARGVALAWKVVALRELEQASEQRAALRELHALGNRGRTVGSRTAMFFSPVSKCPVTFERLLEEIGA
jgi:tetratricopeptide (TPR) repeat protein